MLDVGLVTRHSGIGPVACVSVLGVVFQHAHSGEQPTRNAATGLSRWHGGQMRLIPLRGKRGAGKFAAVSDEDFEFLSARKWRLTTSGYAVCGVRAGDRMHRIIAERMGLDLSMQIDHKNGDKLENTRHTLRAATPTQNAANRTVSVNNKTGIKGVKWHNKNRVFVASITINKQRKHLGSFSDAISAGEAYAKAAREAFGEFARY